MTQTFTVIANADKSKAYFDHEVALVATFQPNTYGRTAEHLFVTECILKMGHRLVSDDDIVVVGTLDEMVD